MGNDEKQDHFWLIERGQEVNHSPTIWWKGGLRTTRKDYADDWTESAIDATKFETYDEAFLHAQDVFGSPLPPDHLLKSVSITQHTFMK